VKIERNDNDENPLARILLDDTVVVEGVKLPRGATGKFVIGLSVSGDAGQSALVAVDNVRTVRKTD
jgi:DNA-binding cell septation regulator SpoVG